MDNPKTTRGVPLSESIVSFLVGGADRDDKIKRVQAALEGREGNFWRKQLGRWAAETVPVEFLVPEEHREWRPLIREAIQFVVLKLSAARLAPKIVEQLTLGPEVPGEVRLLQFIAKVPGLQKIGQVLARNRRVHPKLRRALVKLENSISDVSIDEIRSIIQSQLEAQIEAYSIHLAPKILSEASVSAVVSFTWRNPEKRRRERGVFKVLKPHIANCYAEDMRILTGLARYLARRRHLTSVRIQRLVETLIEIRLLLEHEVDFPREQATLASELAAYRALPGIRVPRLIPALSTAGITALTFERGKKITQVHALPAELRSNVAERLTQALLALPALSRERDAIFHADPHAGNLLYDRKNDEVVILDWALTERLTRRQRKNVMLLVLLMLLRDAEGMIKAVADLCPGAAGADRVQMDTIRAHVERLLDRLPLTQLPGPLDAMRLLDTIALDGMRFPAALLMYRKAAFTLEGVVQDIAGRPVRLDTLVTSHAAENWKDTITSLVRLLSPRDWIALDWSTVTFGTRVCTRALLRPWSWAAVPAAKPDAA